MQSLNSNQKLQIPLQNGLTIGLKQLKSSYLARGAMPLSLAELRVLFSTLSLNFLSILKDLLAKLHLVKATTGTGAGKWVNM